MAIKTLSINEQLIDNIAAAPQPGHTPNKESIDPQ
jgi:hypothetical protein